jgi:uncharacterized protein YciI
MKMKNQPKRRFLTLFFYGIVISQLLHTDCLPFAVKVIFLKNKTEADMYYILFYKTVENYVERRASFRSDHLDLVQNYHDAGHLVMAGALADPADGAVLIFKGDTPAAAEAFVAADPYVRNGLIIEWSVRPWTVVVGG